MAGFDVSQFFSPFRGDPLGGQKMQLEAALQGTRNTTQAAQVLQEGLQQRRQQQMLREQLGLRAQQLESLDRARAAAGERATARLGFDREKFGFEQQKYQGGADAEAVQALMSALRRGDTNALATASAAATAKDPSLTVRLPGERTTNEVGTSTPEGMTFTVDEAYPEDMNKLRVLRGDRPLLEMDRATAQQNEQDLYDAATAGLAKSPFAAMYAPAVESGIGTAGHGATGAEAAESATKMAQNERDALLRREGHDAMLGSRQAAQAATAENRKLQQDLSVHRAIEAVVKDYKPQVKELNDDSAMLQNMLTQMGSGSAWQQNEAFATSILRMSGKASTEPEMRRLQSRSGQWDRLQMMANGWLRGGEIPEQMLKEFAESTELLLRANQARRMQLGSEAKDRIYASSELPFGDEERAVRAANQAWTGLGNPSLTPEEMAQEVARLRKARGMAGGPARPRGDTAPGVPGAPPADGDGWQPSIDTTTGAARGLPPIEPGGMGGLPTTAPRIGRPSQPFKGAAVGATPPFDPYAPQQQRPPEEDDDAALIRELEAF